MVSQHFFKKNEARFHREHRADRNLLANLRHVRQKLLKLNLSDDISHDLLARIIFIQFLMDRKDVSGTPALNTGELKRLHVIGVLLEPHTDLGSILANYEDAYSLFRWLNERFNGDLFPGKGETEAEREAGWEAERLQVTPEHLNVLARFVSGNEKMDNGQLCLWRQYAFDAIPLEFISSIYEEFVRKQASKGIHYTPGHLVDFMLDSVLPWDSKEWNIKILDPACGSGIFLVKAFQRLIHCWKNAHEGQKPHARALSSLLENNLVGVDQDPHAVRVASFSLYLAMCDEINPRDYWTSVQFPTLRGRRLLALDFFKEDTDVSRALLSPQYDLVIGNPPFGQDTATQEALDWALDPENDWETSYKDIGILFLAKAISLLKPEGRVCMIQAASFLLYNRSGTVEAYRKKLYGSVRVEEIVNLSALRMGLFKDAIVPACAITVCKIEPYNSFIWYYCPKPIYTAEDHYRIVIEPQDIHKVYLNEATDPRIWSILMWGGRRDLVLVQRLQTMTSLHSLKKAKIAKTRQGIIRGSNNQRDLPDIQGKRILEGDDFPERTWPQIAAADLPVNRNTKVHAKDSVSLSAFALPQLLIAMSWKAEAGRFQAVRVKSDATVGPLLCSRSFMTAHVPKEYSSFLDAACFSYNSYVALYFLLLTSGRFAFYRPEPLVEDLLSVPLPEPREGLMDGITNVTDIDAKTKEVFAFQDAEWALIEDLARFTLPDFKGDADSPGRHPTRASEQSVEYPDTQLLEYCDQFLRVLKAGFGKDKCISATIYQEDMADLLPVRMVAIHLEGCTGGNIRTEKMEGTLLRERLNTLYQTLLKRPEERDGASFYQRVLRMSTSTYEQGKQVVTIYLVKPDQRRYWTRSSAMRDADEVTYDIMLWHEESNALPESPGEGAGA